MKTLIIYYSKFGNTKEIAEAIAEKLALSSECRLVRCDELVIADFQLAELVIIGSPTHKMNLPQEVKTTFEGLPRRVLKKIPGAVFDTSYRMSPWLAPFTASKKLAGKLRKLGGRLVLPPETFFVAGREGTLLEGELDRASKWAESILVHVNSL